MKAMEDRLHKNKRWRLVKPLKADRILEKIGAYFEECTLQNTRKKMYQFANQYFTSNITNPEIQTDPRN